VLHNQNSTEPRAVNACNTTKKNLSFEKKKTLVTVNGGIATTPLWVDHSFEGIID